MANHTIAGNASESTKDHVCGVLPSIWRRGGDGFGDDIGKRFVITEVSIHAVDDVPSRQSAKVVVECSVEKGKETEFASRSLRCRGSWLYLPQTC
jgi:hypothetical protein